MKGFKVFNPDWTCREFQFEVGKVFEQHVKPKCCRVGFHFCTKPIDCFKYYAFNPENKVAEIEALGDIDTYEIDSKCCTNKIRIVRELTWHEVLDLVNIGLNNTGQGNTGNSNPGNWNTGDHNNGNYNTGHENTGNHNCGKFNTGSWNTGSHNTGHYNTGFKNSGIYNSGNRNSGCNNSGDYNRGDFNSGHKNTGNCNSGCHNSGNRNSGDWNDTSFSNGCFNTKPPKIFLFNKLSDWTYKDWLNSTARYILSSCPSDALIWVPKVCMTEQEKEKHPEYTSTGGFLKHVETVKYTLQAWWDGLSDEDKEVIESLPNFDPVIFEKITKIKVK